MCGGRRGPSKHGSRWRRRGRRHGRRRGRSKHRSGWWGQDRRHGRRRSRGGHRSRRRVRGRHHGGWRGRGGHHDGRRGRGKLRGRPHCRRRCGPARRRIHRTHRSVVSPSRDHHGRRGRRGREWRLWSSRNTGSLTLRSGCRTGHPVARRSCRVHHDTWRRAGRVWRLGADRHRQRPCVDSAAHFFIRDQETYNATAVAAVAIISTVLAGTNGSSRHGAGHRGRCSSCHFRRSCALPNLRHARPSSREPQSPSGAGMTAPTRGERRRRQHRLRGQTPGGRRWRQHSGPRRRRRR